MSSPLEKYSYEAFEKIDASDPFYLLRTRAFDAFQQLGCPMPKTENYKNTPIACLLADSLFYKSEHSIAQLHLVDWEKISKYLDASCYNLVFVNGQLSEIYSNLPEMQSSMTLFSFSGGTSQQKITIQQYMEQCSTYQDPFAALNGALFDPGYCLQIGDNIIVDKPICIYHITLAQEELTIIMPKLFIIVGKNSQATTIQSWHSVGSSKKYFENRVAEVFLEKNAHLFCYNMQEQDDNAYYVHTANFHQAPDSTLHNYYFSFGTPLVRNNVTTTSNGSNTTTNLYGLYCLESTHHVDNHVQVNHLQPNTYSKQHYKGILAEESTGIFNGKIYVAASGQKTNAFQTNNTILLSNIAKSYIKPQLEIYADDVKCSHGATTGQLDKDQLFYLRARGVPEQAARQLLLQAFAGEIIEEVPLKALKGYLYKKIEAKL